MTQIDARSIIPPMPQPGSLDAHAVEQQDARFGVAGVRGELLAIELKLTTLLDTGQDGRTAARVRHALLEVDDAVRHLTSGRSGKRARWNSGRRRV